MSYSLRNPGFLNTALARQKLTGDVDKMDLDSQQSDWNGWDSACVVTSSCHFMSTNHVPTLIRTFLWMFVEGIQSSNARAMPNLSYSASCQRDHPHQSPSCCSVRWWFVIFDKLAGSLTFCWSKGLDWRGRAAWPGPRVEKNVHLDVERTWSSWVDRPVCGPGVRSGPGRPAAWRPASSSAGLVPTGGPRALSLELEGKQQHQNLNEGCNSALHV